MRITLRTTLLAAAAVAMTGLAPSIASSHPNKAAHEHGAAKDDGHGHGKGKGHGHGAGHGHGKGEGTGKGKGASDSPTPLANAKPSADEIKQRLARIKSRREQRAPKLDQLRKDRRAALRKRMGFRLRNGPMRAPVKAELKVHAKRMARLHQVRYIAATKDDYETVSAVDKLIARENYRHETWWRKAARTRLPKTAASAAAGSK